MLIGSIEDVQVPFEPPRNEVGRRPVSLQIKHVGGNGPFFEWFMVARPLRQRIFDLARHEKLPMGVKCVFMLEESGAVIGFIVVR